MARTILLIHGSAGGYGADRQLLLLASVLDRSRFEPLVVLPERGQLGDALERIGVEIHIEPLAVLRRDLLRGRRMPRTMDLLRSNVRSLTALARRHRVAIVHSNMSLILCGQAVAERARVPHVVSVREIYSGMGGAPGVALWPVLRRRLLRADALACVSGAAAAQFGGSPRAFVLHDGLPRDLDLPARTPARQRLGLDPDRFVAAVIGRISDWKGQDVFARALAEHPLAELGAIGVVAGDAAGGQQHFERRLAALGGGLGLDSRLRLLGFRDDVETVLAAADAVVVPSRYEDPLPNVAIESAAAGLPVVCTDTGGQREIVEDGVTGRVVAAGDHLALAAVLRELADDSDAARRLGEAAAVGVRDRFGRDRLAAEIQECYERLLPQAQPARARRQTQRPRLVSVVVPIRNEEEHLPGQLEALAAQGYTGDWELVIVDNGCTDRSLDVVEAWRDRLPPVRVVDASEMASLNHARNRGAAAARGELLAFCDGDDAAEPGWLASLVEAASEADLVSGPLDGEALNGHVASAGWIPHDRLTELPLAYGFLPYAPGGNCAVWARLAQELRWNEQYALGASDVEFSWRAHLAGADLAFAPGAVMRRRDPSTLGDLGRKYFRYGLAAPRVYREFRAAGMPRSDEREALALWVWLVRGAPRAARGREFRGRWVRVAAGRLGRLAGSLRQRVLYL